MEFDYIIIGQGICGTFLSWNLIKAGKKILVIDELQKFSSTKVASGIINPVTGRRVVTTWMIEELLSFAWNGDALVQWNTSKGPEEPSCLDFRKGSIAG